MMSRKKETAFCLNQSHLRKNCQISNLKKWKEGKILHKQLILMSRLKATFWYLTRSRSKSIFQKSILANKSIEQSLKFYSWLRKNIWWSKKQKLTKITAPPVMITQQKKRSKDLSTWKEWALSDLFLFYDKAATKNWEQKKEVSPNAKK